MARWAVRKRDGVWVVLDHRGGLRFAADEWRKAVTFALLCGRPLPPVVAGTVRPGYIEFRAVSADEYIDQMQKSIERIMRRFREGGE